MLMKDIRAAWLTLPIQSLDALLDGRTPLILAPHPDDESLGCGGLIAQCAERGIAAQVAILTDGSRSHPESRSHPPPLLAKVRRAEAEQALSILGLAVKSLHWIGIEDTRLPSQGEAAEEVAATLSDVMVRTGCSLIIAPWGQDPHCDHEAAQAIGQRLAQRHGVPLLSYPVWGWTLLDDEELPVQTVAGMRLEISRQLQLKQQATAAHATQYSGVITDVPDGFVLPEALLSVFRQPYETFLLS
jgi:LmbE family N-acetylglucosaminyl deacetylase